MKRINNDLDTKLQGNVDIDTVDWIWHRLAATGPHGAQYVAKFEPIFRQELADLQSRKSP